MILIVSQFAALLIYLLPSFLFLMELSRYCLFDYLAIVNLITQAFSLEFRRSVLYVTFFQDIFYQCIMFNLVSLNTIRKSPPVACACESFLRESSPLYKIPRASKLVRENRFETVCFARLFPSSEKLHFLLVFVSTLQAYVKLSVVE